jgi:YidC/Oxa1 family membrane protein insertase
MPVFIALYQTLRDIQKFIPVDSAMYHDICGKAVPSKCTPDMHFAGMNLTTSASKAMSSGLSVGWPYLVLVAFVVVTGFVQQRQTMRNQTQPNPQMAIISKIFPVVFAFITWGLPSGVGLYFATSNLWQIGQQEVVYRTMMNPSSAPPPKKGEAEIEGSTGKGGGKGGGTATATKAAGAKSSGAKPGASAARAASRGSGSSKPAAKPAAKPEAKSGGGEAKGSTNGSKNGNGQARPAGGARSNRKRKR